MNNSLLKFWPARALDNRHHYRPTPKPRRLVASSHELERHQLTMDALLRDRYRVAFEPGCAMGGLTARLATRCDTVIAQDVAKAAVANAQRRCGCYQNVHISQADLAVELPDQELDLIIFSEIGHYFTAAKLRELSRQMAARLGANGEFVAVHWLGRSTDQRLYADQVHAVLADALPLLSVKRIRYPQFRLDTWIQA